MSEKNKSIAEKLAQLGELVAWFESEDFVLEAALDKFSEAEKLAQDIDATLDDYKNKITVLKHDFSREE